MGMNLHPINKKLESDGGDFNWTGWSTLGRLLEGLGCDLSEMSGSNDGDLISDATCKAWATAIKKELDANNLVTLDKEFNFITRNCAEESSKHWKGSTIGELTERERKWLLEHCHFFEHCGGCKQF